MIERKILYYPTILVPSRWLKWATLYWDKTSSIVPSGWEDKSSFIHPPHEEDYRTMNYLWEEGLFEPTRPSDFWDKTRQLRMPLGQEFREALYSPGFQARINRNWHKNPTNRVHRDKLSERILNLLHNSKLARMDRKNPGWLLVEENTSLLYMGLLAKHLADADADLTVPSTDRDEYETMIYGTDIKEARFPSFMTKFLDVLPIPRDDVPIRDIVRFRRKRENELLQFREVIDKLQKEISQTKNKADIKRVLVGNRERIQKEISSLKELMGDFGIKTTLATIRSLISIKSPVIIETMGFSMAGVPLIISVPIIAGTAIIQVGYVWVDRRNKQRAEMRKSPFTYLYYADKAKLLQ